MPALDFMLTAQYVRHSHGITDIFGIGADTLTARVVPSAHPLGIAVGLRFDSTEAPGERHDLRFVFHGEDKDLLTLRTAIITPDRIKGVPLHWKTGVTLAMQLTLPIPQYGDYLLTLMIDDKPAHEIDLRAVPASNGPSDEA